MNPEPKRQTVVQADSSKDVGNTKLVDAKDSIKEKLLRAVMQQALAEIGDSDSIAKQAVAMLGSDMTQLPEAATRVRELLVQKIADNALKSIADSDQLAREVADSVSLDQTQVRSVVDALRARLAKSIQQVTLASLADANRTAAEIARNIPTDGTEIQTVVATLRHQLVSTVKSDVLRQLQSTDRIVQEIRASLPHDTESLQAIRRQLYDMLVNDARKQALSQVQDTSDVAGQIRAELGDSPESVLRIGTEVQTMLTAEAKRRSLETLADSEKVADEIVSMLGDNPGVVTNAAEIARSQVIDTIVHQTSGRLDNTEETAREARSRLDSSRQEEAATHHLTNVLLREIAGRSLGSISDAESAADAAYAFVDRHAVELEHVKDLLKTRILCEMLARAVNEIGLEAGSTASQMGSEPLHNLAGRIAGDEIEVVAAQLIRSTSEESIPDASTSSTGVHASIFSEDLGEVHPPVAVQGISSDDSGSETEAAELEALLSGNVDTSEAVEAAKSDWDLEEKQAGSEIQDSSDEALLADDVEPAELWLTTDESDEASWIDDGPHEASWVFDESAATTAGLQAADAPTAEPPAEDTAAVPESVEDYGFGRESGVGSELATESPAVESQPQAAEPSWHSLDSLAQETSTGEQKVAAEPAVQPVGQDHGTPPVTHDGSVEAGHEGFERMPEAEAQPTPESIEASEEPDRVRGSVCYLYGIMAAAVDVFNGPMPLGIQSGRVETVDYDGLSAIVSVVQADMFSGTTLKSNLSNAAWLQDNVRKHASIIEQLRSRQTLLPMPFCTVLPNRDRIVRMLQSNYGSYRDALERVEGKQEWGLRIYRNKTVLSERVSESDRRVEGALGEISRGVSGYLREEMTRMEAENRLDPMELVTEHCTQRSHEALLLISAEGRMNPDRGGQKRPGEELVLNTAYLVEDNTDSEIRAEVERLKAEYAELGFRFELTGPWPPYHFVNAEGGQRKAVEVED